MARAGAPEKKDCQKARRGLPRAIIRSAAPRSALASEASGPSEGDSMASMRARTICASTGPVPSVPIATDSGARLTSAGVKKSQISGRSTALAGIFRCRASATMRRSRAASPVAAKTMTAPSS